MIFRAERPRTAPRTNTVERIVLSVSEVFCRTYRLNSVTRLKSTLIRRNAASVGVNKWSENRNPRGRL